MAKPDLSIVGKKFGRWFVDSFAHTRASNAYFNCTCECGGTKKVMGASLKSGDSKSCGCLLKEFNQDRPTSSGDLRKDIYNNYKVGARRRDYSFELSEEKFYELVQKPCVYCGEQGTKQTRQGVQKNIFYYTGLDRVDNTRGYTEDNVVPCCRTCNTLKTNLHVSTFMNKVKQIYEHTHALSCNDVLEPKDRENVGHNHIGEQLPKHVQAQAA